MAKDPNVPAAFDVYTLVVLRRPSNPPEMSQEDLDALQGRHLAYRAELGRQGVLVVNGPLLEQSEPLRSASGHRPDRQPGASAARPGAQ